MLTKSGAKLLDFGLARATGLGPSSDRSGSPTIAGPLTAEGTIFQGLRDDDVVHSIYGHGKVTGGHCVRATVLHWAGARFIPAGTGVETRPCTQVELMRDRVVSLCGQL
jgi:hypothetical protein